MHGLIPIFTCLRVCAAYLSLAASRRVSAYPRYCRKNTAARTSRATTTPKLNSETMSSNGASATDRTPLRRNGAGSARATAHFGASTATAKNSQMKMPPSAASAAAAAAAAAAALTEPPLPPDHYPATVYRYTKTRGWERYRSSTPQFGAARSRRRLLAGAASSSQTAAAAAAAGKGSTSSSVVADYHQQVQQQPVCAVPRRGCVEVRALRLRIRLFAEVDPNGAENISGTNHNQGGTVSGTTSSTSSTSKENTLVIRRSSRVLLSSRRNLGAVVLKFRSVTMAMDFCSRLMELNAAAHASDGALAGGSGGVYNLGGIGTIGGSRMSNPMSLGGPPSSLSTMGMPVMQPSAGLGSRSSGGGSIGTSSVPSNGEQQQQSEADMASYMVRLLHDPSFLTFVNSMENALTTSVAGGELMLKALATSSAIAPSASSASS